MLIRIARFAAVIAVISGCGDDSAGRFDVIPAADVTVAAGESATVAVTIEREGGFTDPIDVALVGRPTGVTGSFSADPVTGDATELTVTASADALVGEHLAYVKATAGDEVEVVEIGVSIEPPAAAPVIGRVVDAFGQPVLDVTVVLDGASATPDADGGFRFEAVATPYDIAVVRPSVDTAHVYKGLTRRDPTLHMVTLFPPASESATVAGTVNDGTGLQNQNDQVTFVMFSGADGGSGSFVVDPLAGPQYGPLTVEWRDGDTVDGTLHALKWRFDRSIHPVEYLGYASAPLTLSRDASVTGQDLTLEPVPTGFISADVAAPSGYTLEEITVWLTLGPRTAIPLAIDRSGDPTVSHAVPLLGIPIGVQARIGVDGSASTVYLAGQNPTTVVHLAPPIAPRLSAPADGATAVDANTVFSWAPYDDGIAVAVFATSSGPSFAVYTVLDARLPDLAEWGMPLPAGASYAWSAVGVGPYASVDAFVAADGGLPVLGGPRDARTAHSQVWSFTTAP